MSIRMPTLLLAAVVSFSPFGGSKPSGATADWLPAIDESHNLGSASMSWNYLYIFGIRDQNTGQNRFTISGSAPNVSTGDAPNSGTNAAARTGNSNTLSGTTRIQEWHNDSAMASPEAFIDNRGFFVNPAQAVVVADDGAGTAAVSTLTPSSGAVSYACNDANGCTITLSETGALDGTFVRITNISANVANFADTAGVTELSAAFAMGQYDSLTLLYVTDRWVETGRSNN
jgi:hypothetical protein